MSQYGDQYQKAASSTAAATATQTRSLERWVFCIYVFLGVTRSILPITHAAVHDLQVEVQRLRDSLASQEEASTSLGRPAPGFKHIGFHLVPEFRRHTPTAKT